MCNRLLLIFFISTFSTVQVNQPDSITWMGGPWIYFAPPTNNLNFQVSENMKETFPGFLIIRNIFIVCFCITSHINTQFDLFFERRLLWKSDSPLTSPITVEPEASFSAFFKFLPSCDVTNNEETGLSADFGGAGRRFVYSRAVLGGTNRRWNEALNASRGVLPAHLRAAAESVTPLWTTLLPRFVLRPKTNFIRGK